MITKNNPRPLRQHLENLAFQLYGFNAAALVFATAALTIVIVCAGGILELLTTDTAENIHPLIQLTLFLTIGISIVGYAFSGLVVYAQRYIKKTYSKTVMQQLPKEIITIRSWVNVAEALNHAANILATLNSHTHQTNECEKNIRYLQNHLFFHSLHEDLHYVDQVPAEVKEIQKLKNIENTVLWLDKLTSSPLLERISMLKEMDTNEKQRAFANRSRQDIIEYFVPLNEFAKYVQNIHVDDEYREKELNKQQVSSQYGRVQKEVDQMFDFGLKSIYNKKDSE